MYLALEHVCHGVSEAHADPSGSLLVIRWGLCETLTSLEMTALICMCCRRATYMPTSGYHYCRRIRAGRE
jgi:hypothetical protein